MPRDTPFLVRIGDLGKPRAAFLCVNLDQSFARRRCEEPNCPAARALTILLPSDEPIQGSRTR